MANVNIDNLPVATAFGLNDKVEVLQGGVNKQATGALIAQAVGAGNVHAVADSFGTATWSSSQVDATAAIQAAVDAAEADTGPALVVLPGRFLKVTSTVTVDGDNVLIVAAHEVPGAWLFDMTNADGAVVRMHAAATVNGPVLDFTNGSLTRRVHGVGLRGVTVDLGSNGFNATIGVRLRSVAAGAWAFAVNRVGAGSTGLLCEVDPALTATQGDNQGNHFEWVSVNANGVHSGKCIHLNGDADSNTSLNFWGHVECYYSDGHGIDMDNCDGELFNHVRMNRVAGSVGRGVIFRNDPGGTSLQYARRNTFVYVQPGAGGVEFESNASGASAPLANHILSYSQGNGSAAAIWGAGATGSVTYQTGTVEVNGAVQSFQASDADLTAIAALTTTAYGRNLLTLANLSALQAVLGTGTPSATNFLRGDGTWTSVPIGDAPKAEAMALVAYTTTTGLVRPTGWAGVLWRGPTFPTEVFDNSADVWIEAVVTDLTVSPSTVAVAVSVAGATASSSAVVTPATVAVTSTIPIPSVSGAGTTAVSASTVPATAAVPAPTVSTSFTFTPATVATVAAVPTPTVTVGGASSAYELEDGSGAYDLEDGSGFYDLE